MRMNKSVILNCKNFKCNFNEKGDCKLSHISLASDGGLIVSKIICENAEEKPDKDDAKTLNLKVK